MPTEIPQFTLPVPSRQDPENFSARADQFVSELPAFVTGANALAGELNDLVQNFGYASTSTTLNTVDVIGPKTFTIQADLSYQAGQFVLIASTASPENYIVGQINSYDDETGDLIISADKAAGGGTFSDWSLSLTISAADEAFITAEADRAGAGADLAESYASAAAASGEVYASTADALSKGVYSLDSLVAGSGGTDGTFALAFSGGAGSGASGWFTVVAGAISAYEITARGRGYTSAPAVSFAASAGLSGASAAAVIAANRAVGQYFLIPSAGGGSFRDEYLVEIGPVATATGRSLSAGESVDVVANTSRTHDAQLSELRGEDQVSADYVWALYDEDNRIPIGVRKDSGVDLRRSHEQVDDNFYRYGLVGGEIDEDGVVARGITNKGELFAQKLHSIFPGRPMDSSQITGPGNIFFARRLVPTAIEFLADGEGATRAYIQRDDISSETVIFSVAGKIDYLPHAGQSLCLGGGSTVTFTTAPLYSYYNFMFNTGTRGVEGNILDGDTLVDFVPAYEQANGVAGETQGSGMMRAQHAKAVLNNEKFKAMVFRANGKGGTTIANLSQGTQPYNNALIELARAVSIASKYGRELQVRSFFFTQGEADRSAGSGRVGYAAFFNNLIADTQVDYAALLPADNPTIKCIFDQLSCAADGAYSVIPLAQYDVFKSNADAYVSTPKYFMGLVDNVHLVAKWYSILGEYQMRVWRELFGDGGSGDWNPVYPTTVSRTDNVIDIECNVVTGNLVIDTSTLPAATNYGFVFKDDSGDTPAISTVELVGGDTIRITLADIPVGPNMVIQYAAEGPGATGRAGGWGNIHDSETETSLTDPSITLYNWLVVFDEAVS